MPDGKDSGEMFEDLLAARSRFTDFLGKAKDRTLSRWQKTSTRMKILLWLPFQAVMFKIQPVLWEGLTTIVSGITSIASGVASLLATLQVQTQLILVLIGLFAVQTTVLSLRLNRYQKTLKRIKKEVGETLVRTEDVLTTVEGIESEVEDVYVDGGKRMNQTEGDTGDMPVKTTGTGAVGGAVAGGAFGGAVGGPAGAIGGAVLGIILGDEAEKRSIKREQRKSLYTVRPPVENSDTGSADRDRNEPPVVAHDRLDTRFSDSVWVKKEAESADSEQCEDQSTRPPRPAESEDKGETDQ